MTEGSMSSVYSLYPCSFTPRSVRPAREGCLVVPSLSSTRTQEDNDAEMTPTHARERIVAGPCCSVPKPVYHLHVHPWINVSDLLGGHDIGLEEVAPDVWCVSFGPVTLGWLHVRKGAILDHDGLSSRNPRR